MSQKSAKRKISEATWTDILRRYIVMGESASALAKEIGVTEGAVRSRASTKRYEVKDLANQIVEVDQKYHSYDRTTKTLVDDMVAQLKLISGNLTRAAIASSDTSARLSIMANKQIANLDPANLLDSESELKIISGMTRMANDASFIGISLINATNKTPKAESQDNDLAGSLRDLIQSLPN